MDEEEIPTSHQAALDVGAPPSRSSWGDGEGSESRERSRERTGEVLARILQRQSDDQASGYGQACRDVEEILQRRLRQAEDTEGRGLLLDVLEKVRELRGL